MYSFPYLEPVCCYMSSSNCCFLTCIQISQEAGQVVWYSHLFKNFPVCGDPHKAFGIVNKAEIDIFLEFSSLFYDPAYVGNLISDSSAFSKSSLKSGSSWFTYCWSLAWRILSITLLAWGSQGKNTEVVCHSLLQWTTFCQTSPSWPACLGWTQMAWDSFIE